MCPSRPSVCRILIGEDCRVSSTLLRGHLVNKGYAVVGVGETGLQTANLFVEHKPDLVLLDIGMPEGSGLTILRLMKEIHPKIPVVMLTGDRSMDTVVEAKNLGAEAYVSKTSDVDDVIGVVERITSIGPRDRNILADS